VALAAKNAPMSSATVRELFIILAHEKGSQGKRAGGPGPGSRCCELTWDETESRVVIKVNHYGRVGLDLRHDFHVLNRY
jgi:hypothetical protein